MPANVVKGIDEKTDAPLKEELAELFKELVAETYDKKLERELNEMRGRIDLIESRGSSLPDDLNNEDFDDSKR